ncbi:SDR family oxidoreductase [Microbacterium aoyamense]|uniref:SDR family oxidoreductase n=1 Tax=Microbacterium aoyamense TaxID=344166 RepID=A0ABP5APU5_9MICO|nr:NAD-dependent epimerase/dehydratase family protein [Microbacterium aoyamense]
MAYPARVLYVGGTGTISAACVRRSVEVGQQVTILTRGNNDKRRELPASVESVVADLDRPDTVREALAGRRFDAVANFIGFDAAGARSAIELFAPLTDQYVHISSASVYHKPVLQVPIVESNWAKNELVSYAQAKVEAELELLRARDERGFPVTIVRPSHTYDEGTPPLPGDWTTIDRLVRGDEVIVSGDGTSLWTLTHAGDFALGFVGLLGNLRAVGETFHITSDDVYTWDVIMNIVARELGVTANIVHIPAELIQVGAPDWFWSELYRGDIGHSAIFDNSKIKRYVPEFVPTRSFRAGAREIAQWREKNPDITTPDASIDAIISRLVRGYHASREAFAAEARSAG